MGQVSETGSVGESLSVHHCGQKSHATICKRCKAITSNRDTMQFDVTDGYPF